MLNLIPYPRHLVYTDGAPLALKDLRTVSMPCGLGAGAREAVGRLLDEVEDLTARRPQLEYAECPAELPGAALVLFLDSEIAEREGYRLAVSADGIRLSAAAECGLFYGLQTLRQLFRLGGPVQPAVSIEDSPELAVRGFYHDVTRGRIPTAETLRQMVDTLAAYKYNQLQLYMEHTFVSRRFPEIWGGSDGLTTEDIIALDHYARERHVELVPSISCFGHCYQLLRGKRFEHLNELEMKASEKPFSFIDRMLHYTLDSSSESSYRLIASLLDEFLPLFSSARCNICCDETFDLGKGRNAGAGDIQRLYCRYVQRLIAKVNSYGKQAMFWGDVIGKSPELLSEFTGDFIVLDWDYSADLSHSLARTYADLKVPFYVCPGTQVWNKPVVPNPDHIHNNIRKAALAARDCHAQGLLVTDWGDYGHVNHPLNSLPGLVLGGALAWNPDSYGEPTEFESALEEAEYGNGHAGLFAVLRKVYQAAKVDGCGMGIAADESDAYGDFDKRMALYLEGISDEDLRKALAALVPLELEFQQAVAKCRPRHPEMRRALLTGMRGLVLFHRVMLLLRSPDADQALEAAEELRWFERYLAEGWHRVSRPAEYYRVRAAIQRVAERLEAQCRPFV